MKTYLQKTAVSVLFLVFFLNSRADFQEELLALSRIDLLPKYRDEAVIRQISSYDTTGDNDDGFSGKYSYLRKENDGLVIAELNGPGVIQRIWTPTPTADTIQFFFDNEAKPRINMKFIDLFSGNHYPFARPVVGNEVGGYYCYLPIPYNRSCKVLFKGKRMQFFQIQYREYVGGESITSFPEKFSEEEKEALELAVKAWNSFGKEVVDMLPSSGAEIKSYTADLLLKPGKTISFFKHNMGGRIIGFELVPQKQLNVQFKDVILRAVWDNEPVAAINCPVSDFFGYAFGNPSMQSMLTGVKGQTHYCYFPMPYDKSASLELIYLDTPENNAGEIPFKVKVYYSTEKKNNDEGRFYAEWRREINPEAGKPYQIMKKNGRGHYVGTLLQSQGLNPGMTWFFEGDDQCYIDGELRIHGTGSEDYFNGGWYALPDRWDQAFSLPVHGCLAYSIPLARTGGYRFYVSDKLPFEKDFSLTIEHGPENNNIPVDYTSVAFYYCVVPPIENNMPPEELLSAIKPPSTLEYWTDLLPVKALSHGATLSKEKKVDKKSGESYSVLKLKAGKNGFAKFELEVPEAGKYKLFLSYFKGPDCSPFAVNQRQIPVTLHSDAFASENTFIDKEYLGSLFIKEGTNTITVVLKEIPEGDVPGNFYLHRIYLEAI